MRMKQIKKYITIILFTVLTIFSCKSSVISDTEWIKKTPLETHNIYQEDEDNFVCVSIGKGYFKIDKNGKISNKKIFKEKDEGINVNNIKLIPNVGVFGILEEDKDNKWIVEILKNFKLKKMIKVPKENKNRKDFLISEDRTRYCGFNYGGYSLGEEPHYWYDIKTGEIVECNSPFSVGNARVYLIKNHYYMDDGSYISVYNKVIVEDKIKHYDSIEFYSKNYVKDLFIQDDYVTNREYKNNLLNGFIYGEDKYLYILPNYRLNKMSWKYYIVKLNLDLNVIGKRNIILKEKINDNRCVSSMFVDKNGWIYVASDKAMTITKFKPIEDGEDSVIEMKD